MLGISDKASNRRPLFAPLEGGRLAKFAAVILQIHNLDGDAIWSGYDHSQEHHVSEHLALKTHA